MLGAKLYVIPGSHPCDCVQAALRLKGIDYRRVDLLPFIHKAIVRARFPGNTVPALQLDGERMIGSRAILRRLDEVAREPRLVPEDPAERGRVEEAEAWGDEVLQPLARRVAWAALRRNRKAMMSYAREAKLGLPAPFVRLGAAPVAIAASNYNRANDENVRADLRALPGHLDRVDSWVADGVIGGETPNVADLQIGSSIRLLRTFGDVRPLLEGRPCERLAEAAFPAPVGSIPAGTLPRDWLPALG